MNADEVEEKNKINEVKKKTKLCDGELVRYKMVLMMRR